MTTKHHQWEIIFESIRSKEIHTVPVPSKEELLLRHIEDYYQKLQKQSHNNNPITDIDIIEAKRILWLSPKSKKTLRSILIMMREILWPRSYIDATTESIDASNTTKNDQNLTSNITNNKTNQHLQTVLETIETHISKNLLITKADLTDYHKTLEIAGINPPFPKKLTEIKDLLLSIIESNSKNENKIW